MAFVHNSVPVVSGHSPLVRTTGLLPALQCEEESPCQELSLRVGEPVDGGVAETTLEKRAGAKQGAKA